MDWRHCQYHSFTALDVVNNYVACLLLNRGKEAVMVANINLIKQENYSIVNLEKQLMSNESPKQTLLNDFSHRLKMEGEEQLCDCVNELKLGLSSNNK